MNNYRPDTPERVRSGEAPASVWADDELGQDVGVTASAELPTVLVADDEPDILMLMMRQLKRAGYHVITAIDGAAALQMARNHLPDLAVFDVQMPTMTGIDVLESLRADPGTMYIPVILISAGFPEHTVKRGLAAGAEDYLKKPLAVTRLSEQVAKALARFDDHPRSTARLARSR